MSRLPSPSTSLRATCTGIASVPVAPKRTVFELTVVASKPFTLKIATLMFLSMLGFILLASLFRSHVNRDRHRSTKLNRPDIADAGTDFLTDQFVDRHSDFPCL